MENDAVAGINVIESADNALLAVSAREELIA